MNMNLLNAIPIPFPEHVQKSKLHFSRVDITDLFPGQNNGLRSAWKATLEKKLQAMDDFHLMKVIATTGIRLRKQLETVFKRAELMDGANSPEAEKAEEKATRNIDRQCDTTAHKVRPSLLPGLRYEWRISHFL